MEERKRGVDGDESTEKVEDQADFECQLVSAMLPNLAVQSNLARLCC